MTYEENDVVTVVKIAIEDPKGDFVKLNDPDGGCSAPSSSGGGFWCLIWWWLKLALVLMFLAVLGVSFFLWIGPFLMNKVQILLILLYTCC